jgi:hypothetical protein
MAFPGQQLHSPAVRWRFPDKISVPRARNGVSRTTIAFPGGQVAFPGQSCDSPHARRRFRDKKPIPRAPGSTQPTVIGRFFRFLSLPSHPGDRPTRPGAVSISRFSFPSHPGGVSISRFRFPYHSGGVSISQFRFPSRGFRIPSHRDGVSIPRWAPIMVRRKAIARDGIGHFSLFWLINHATSLSKSRRSSASARPRWLTPSFSFTVSSPKVFFKGG